MLDLVIVEDESNIRDCLTHLFPWNSLGINVVANFSNGQDAFHYLSHEHADILLTDIRLPNISGLDLIRMLRESKNPIEVVILTGYKHFDYAQQAIRYQVHDVLLKPIKYEELTAAMLKIKDSLEKRTDSVDSIDESDNTYHQKLISIGSSYLRIMGITYLCWGITEVYLAILRSIGRVTISMALNMLAFILNIILNATFIFGLFGAPKLGATGVAIATAASRLIELAACVIVSFLSKDVKLNLTFMFIRSKVLFGDFVRLSLPALGNDVSWSVAFSMYSVILGHLGTDAVAANSLVTVVRNIGSVFCFAIASAGTILLGNVMGKGDLEKSKVYASRMLKMTIIAGAIGGVIVFAITPLVLRFASLSDGAMHYLKYMLLINTYYIMGSAVNTALIAGVFRAGGDTKFGLICDTIDMWVYAVPLGFFAAFVLKLPVLWVYFLLCTDEFVKWPWVFHHYRQGKWAQNITREDLFEQKAS